MYVCPHHHHHHHRRRHHHYPRCPVLQLSGTLIWMTRAISELETNIVSVERLEEYSELETEVSARHTARGLRDS